MVPIASGPTARTPSNAARDPSGPDIADPESATGPTAPDDELGLGLDRAPASLNRITGRWAFVVILTCVVMVVAVVIAVWMYWLGGQLPSASMPVS
jgi:hypothetical protein